MYFISVFLRKSEGLNTNKSEKILEMIKSRKPYIKKLGKFSGFTVWSVDGNYIRKYIDMDFTNFAQHYRFPFIPADEFWIDKEFGKHSETKYFVDHMLVENRLMSEGKSYSEAIDVADKVERRERRKALMLERKNGNGSKRKKIIDRIRLRLLKQYSGKYLKVWVVDGNLVRDKFRVEFTEGGHDKVYDFVPVNEVWLDDDLSQKERKFVLLHELHERYLMCKGWIYDSNKLNERKSAHRSATKIEYHCRHYPKDLDKNLKKELKKNVKFNSKVAEKK